MVCIDVINKFARRIKTNVKENIGLQFKWKNVSIDDLKKFADEIKLLAGEILIFTMGIKVNN